MLLALAGFRWMLPVEGMNVLFVLDQSDSVSPADQESARSWVEQVVAPKPASDRAGLIVFGSHPTIESSVTPNPDLGRIDAVLATSRTDIAAAIRLASAAFPESGQRRIVLVSDGNENLGNALDAALAARAAGIRVDVVPVETRRPNDISIQRLQLPSSITLGQPFEAKVFVEAHEPVTATFHFYRNDQYLGAQETRLDAGKNVLGLPQTLSEPGFYSYDVRLEAPGDRVPQNNRAFAFTQVRGLPRILVVSDRPDADQALTEALRSSGHELHVVPVTGFPNSLETLQSYDALVLSNVEAGDLGRDPMTHLEIAVRDFGMGWVCIGGDRTYAAGAYRGTPLASLLPVDVEMSSKKVLPVGALVLIVDRSGSMSGANIEMARLGAAAAVQALAPGDFVGVIAFDGQPHIVADIQPAAQRAGILRNIAGIRVEGGTVMHPAMVQAHAMLRSVSASLKHCVILTDGVSQPGDFEGVTQAMAADHITVSTVGIGEDIDEPLLQSIAAIGGGRFHAAPSPSLIPQIFIKETAVVLKAAIQEEPFTPRRVLASEPVRGIPPEAFPPLQGYVTTEPRARAETPLVTSNGDPLLAHWQYGLGRVVAFTSDARAKWARDWLTWNQYQTFWRQVVHWSLRRLEDSDFTVELTTDRGEGRVVVDALDANGAFRNDLNLHGRIVAPGGSTNLVSLRPIAPGRYEATFPMRDSGAYLLNLLQLEKGQVRSAQVLGANLNDHPEFSASGPNLALLRRIAESTGGTLLDPDRPGTSPFLDGRQTTWQPYDLWEWLLKLAVILWVLDVAIRRLDPDLEAWRSVWRTALARLPFLAPKPIEPPSSQGSLGTLLAHRDGVRARTAPQTTGQGTPFSPGIVAQPGESALPRVVVATQATMTEPTDPTGTTDRLLQAKRRAQSKAS
jgi:uncharacterized membrane protein/secreted protein with Ig-like and vWFA domain